MSKFPPIGNDGLLTFIDEINEIRARSGQRYRFRPQRKDSGVLGMHEFYEIHHPRPGTTRSQRYATTPTQHFGYKD